MDLNTQLEVNQILTSVLIVRLSLMIKQKKKWKMLWHGLQEKLMNKLNEIKTLLKQYETAIQKKDTFGQLNTLTTIREKIEEERKRSSAEFQIMLAQEGQTQ